MAAINFVKGEQYYTAEFQINGPVNVHIERAEAGALYFRQRSIDHGSYDLINGANWNNRGDLTIDTAIQGVVYPMWIKIESASEPTLAEMVEGEQSGGGAGTESGGEAESVSKYIKGIEYYAVNYDKLVELGYDSSDMNITTPSGMLNQALIPACGGKIFINGLSSVLGPGIFDLYRGFFNAPIIGIYYINVLQQSPDDPSIWLPLTFKEFITSQPIGGVFNEAFTEITEEEFYSLSEFVSIRDLYQPTTSDVDMNTGYLGGVTNCDKVTEIQVLGPDVYEEVDQLAVTFMNTSKNLIASLATNTTEFDSRLIWTTESATGDVSSGVIYTITPDNVVTRNEEEIDKFNAILAGDDFRYAIANAGAGFTEAQFDVLDKFIKVKKG